MKEKTSAMRGKKKKSPRFLTISLSSREKWSKQKLKNELAQLANKKNELKIWNRAEPSL